MSGTARISPDGEVSVSDVDEQELTSVLLDVVAVTEENGLKLPREVRGHDIVRLHCQL